MDKKKLAILIEEIISDVATVNKVSEEEARTLVGLSLRHNRATIVNSIKIETFGPAEPAGDHRLARELVSEADLDAAWAEPDYRDHMCR